MRARSLEYSLMRGRSRKKRGRGGCQSSKKGRSRRRRNSIF